MMKQTSAAALLVVAAILSGCAQDRQVELDAKTVSTVHRVTLVGPANPVPLTVVTQREINAQRAVSAAAAIPFAGVLGAAVAGGVAGAISAEVARETSKPLNDEVVAEKYDYASALQDALATALKANGYEVSTATVAHKPGRFAEKIDGLTGNPELIIDAVATATCTDVAPGEKAHFRPQVRVQIRLTHPGDATPIMNKTFVYDDAIAKPDPFQIKGDPQYDIADYAALKGNIKGCLDGIKASAAPLASAVIDVVATKKSVVAAN